MYVGQLESFYTSLQTPSFSGLIRACDKIVKHQLAILKSIILVTTNYVYHIPQ